MKNLNMYCLTMNPQHLRVIKKIGYTPVGLGKKKFSKSFTTDKKKFNIANKNSFYGEYTFHYWLWKNKKIKLNKNWIGFCQYRKFWVKKKNFNKNNFDEFNRNLVKEIPLKYNKFETILGNELYVNKFKFSKFIKKNFINILKNPSLLFVKSKRTIKFHFDLMHGRGNLDKAIELLDSRERHDFRRYVNSEVSFNPHNMFICRNSEILKKYYQSVFTWLGRCEKIFGFKDLNSYGQRRIYGFLAERYLSYWFKKYTKYKILPICFKDISDFL